MRSILALTIMLAAGSAAAQQATPSTINEPGTRADGTHAPSRVSPGPPIDRGPTTPGANQAFQGGGMVQESVTTTVTPGTVTVITPVAPIR